jgi:outer membrane protein OmpA-like peptidoglycan-associated protein
MNTKFGTIFAACVLAIAISYGAEAQVQQMGSQPKADDLIKALTPNAGGSPGPLAVRGIRVLNAAPGGAAEAPHPSAVALDVKFALGSADLTDSARQTVGQLAKAIKSEQLMPYRFTLSGHTDSTGKPDANLALSQRRAEAVKQYLVSNFGISADRLEAVGRGQEEPIDPAHPESGVNRRVQVAIVGSN